VEPIIEYVTCFIDVSDGLGWYHSVIKLVGVRELDELDAPRKLVPSAAV
jgi:hypothetical protein